MTDFHFSGFPRHSVPKTLYKYIKSMHADDFIKGKVLVGSAARCEKMQGAASDDELRKTFPASLGPKAVVTWTPADDGIPVAVPPMKLSFTAEAAPYSLWCSSMVCSKGVLPRFKGYDTILKISNVPDFLRRLVLAGLRFGFGHDGGVFGPVRYVSKFIFDDDAADGVSLLAINHPAFPGVCKNKQYEAEQEFRVIWYGNVNNYDSIEVDMGSNAECVEDVTSAY